MKQQFFRGREGDARFLHKSRDRSGGKKRLQETSIRVVVPLYFPNTGKLSLRIIIKKKKKGGKKKKLREGRRNVCDNWERKGGGGGTILFVDGFDQSINDDIVSRWYRDATHDGRAQVNVTGVNFEVTPVCVKEILLAIEVKLRVLQVLGSSDSNSNWNTFRR